MVKTQRKIRNAKPEPSASAGTASDVRLKGLICLLLIAVTVVAYWQVFGCKFIECYDDHDYVTKNTFITKGLGLGSLTWAFTTFRLGNWHPLTWLSYMADYRMYGLDPAGYHLTNLLFHIANTLILFLVLSRMTGAVWKSGFVAALFAIHPLHVESVAWVAERKDMLSTFFWLITMYAYVLYAKRPSIGRYVPVVVAFGLGLMCKPMLVSLPLVLLLLDYWPLDRASLRWRLVWEKAPLLVMSAASCIITFVAQRSGGAVTNLDVLPLGFRIGNAAVSYIAYVLKMVWPRGLAVFYGHPMVNLPIWEAVGAAVVLTGVTVLALRNGRRRPYLTVGWLWYLITLVPVIGIVQVGAQAMADRYTYITLTGLFVIIAWGIPDLISRRGIALRGLLPASASALIVILGVCTWFQVGVWRDSYSVFDHAIKVTRDNFYAYQMRGVALDDQGRPEAAIRDFSRAIELHPNFAPAHDSLGAELVKMGKTNEGIGHLVTALRLGRNTGLLHHNLACGYFNLGRLGAAIEQCLIALRLDPTLPDAHNLLAVILAKQGKTEEAISHLNSAVALAPGYADPHANLAMAYYSKRDYTAAWREIHLYQAKGGQPDPEFIADLSKRMPDPAR